MNIFQEIFTIEGRLNRGKFFKYYILITLMGATATFVTSCMATLLTGDPNGTLVKMITVIWAVLATAGACMLMVRRLHDLNRNGALFLISFIPIVGLIFLAYLFFAEGQAGYNKYGADPLEKLS
ncbi:MAG: DUF805 domain-containing protein [Selenomonadaceae bacterium]|nr:DUF805 domain-containing protein [Selenomonadaceae bacterium]